MITLGGDAELELVDSLDPFSEGIVFRYVGWHVFIWATGQECAGNGNVCSKSIDGGAGTLWCSVRCVRTVRMTKDMTCIVCECRYGRVLGDVCGIVVQTCVCAQVHGEVMGVCC